MLVNLKKSNIDLDINFIYKDLLCNFIYFFDLNLEFKSKKYMKFNLNFFNILDLDDIFIGRYCFLIYLMFGVKFFIKNLCSYTKQGNKTYGGTAFLDFNQLDNIFNFLIFFLKAFYLI
jgi:hypothetical protein